MQSNLSLVTIKVLMPQDQNRRDRYQAEYDSKQAALVRNRISLLCGLTLGVYFITTFLLILLRPAEFKAEEFFVWGILLLGGGTVFGLSRRVRGLGGAKLTAYLFAAFAFSLLVWLGLIYPENLASSAVYYVLAFFLVCHTIPWKAQDVIVLGVLEILAYHLFCTLRTGALLAAGETAPALWNQRVDGLLLILIALGIGFVIRRRETARDLENFLLLKEVEAKNDQIQKELELARRIHKTLIPDSISTPRADLIVTYLPVHTIGGDYARFHFIGSDRLIFIICDVTGHGVPAALMVNRVHTEFERLARTAEAPGLLLRELDRFILKDFEGTQMYLTAFAGLLDFSRSRFLYSNYGHPPQYLYQARRGEVYPLNSQTTLLGFSLREQEIYQKEVGFDPEDRLLLFTDGLLESAGPGPGLQGPERIEKFLKTNDALPYPLFNQRLLEELNSHRKGAFKDDVFLLSIKIH